MSENTVIQLLGRRLRLAAVHLHHDIEFLGAGPEARQCGGVQ